MVRISNFGPIQGLQLELADLTPVVGPNNAGKSTVLKALAWLVSRSALSEKDFNSTDRPVSVDARISGVDDEVLDGLDAKHAKRVAEYVVNGSVNIRVIQRDHSATGKKAVEVQVQKPRPGVDFDDDAWEPNPNGIPEALNALFPAPIFISAMAVASDDVGRLRQSNTLGKIMGEIAEQLKDMHEDDVAEALSVISDVFGADGERRAEVLRQIDHGTTGAAADFFPGVELRLHVTPPDFKAILASSTFKVKESGGNGFRDFDDLGHGAQRAIQMALIRYLAEIKTTRDSARRTLLLIDEPESYLHPQAIDLVRVALRRMSEAGYQVVFSTHSAGMVGLSDAPRTLIVEKDERTGTCVKPRAVEILNEAAGGADAHAAAMFRAGNLRELLFCRRIVFVEGVTEIECIPVMTELAGGKSLRSSGIGVLEVGGKDSFLGASKIAAALGVQHVVVADLDFLVRTGVTAGLVDAKSEPYLELLAGLRRVADSHDGVHLGEDGLPRSPKGEQGGLRPSAVFELLAADADAAAAINEICGALRAKGVWVWTRGAIEKHLGLPSKKLAARAAMIADAQAESRAPAEFDHDGFRELAEWLVGENWAWGHSAINAR